ncbi:adenylate kinase [Saprolegnia diclina VS20]|uniref:Adenylate kinase n=1 Tax=Saprolegnia diclina (strain VS20) TaxID=1156394 RepID=T0Q7F1_SAPDV|nr:adenylate kinase [Saprolegnia diclina VS20]EQC30521.1 adenylate kinase [Saprolegnia diclina VS20]|eukprot:XP_008616114.1 adenylate kinase [Saprolegnia diclina VS20]
MRSTSPKLVICGPPAGGKGTQCELLVAKFNLVHLSTGDMLRAAIQAGSPLGKEAQAYMDAGDLVPDALIIQVVLARLEEDDCKQRGWLLDGFPRTQAQAEAMLAHHIVPSLVILLDVPDEEVIKRISGRRVDLATGKTYHITFNPPPPGVEVVQRSDDTESTIKNRLAKFHDNCGAVVGAFASVATLCKVDGMLPKEDVFATIECSMTPPGFWSTLWSKLQFWKE